MSYFENVGFAGEPLYVARTGDDNPFDGVSAASYSSPTLVYWDADGDLDLVASRADVKFPHVLGRRRSGRVNDIHAGCGRQGRLARAI